jgi:protein-tyrosine phosphatase
MAMAAGEIMESTERWLRLDGTSNTRDLGGLPTSDGRTTARHRLIRSDSLQDLSEQDVKILVNEIGVRGVVDLRTGIERASEQPGALHREPLVLIEHRSLFKEDEAVPGSPSGDGRNGKDVPLVLPWNSRDSNGKQVNEAAELYSRFLVERPDSVLHALRLVANPEGATIVHCTAGKDRTGVIAALALSAVGVTREAIVADYVQTAERIDAILRRMKAKPLFASIKLEEVGKHTPKAETIRNLLETIDSQFGSVAGFLSHHGWTPDEQARLRTKLLR